MKIEILKNINIPDGASADIYSVTSGVIYGFVIRLSSLKSAVKVHDGLEVMMNLNMKDLKSITDSKETSWVTYLDDNTFQFEFTNPIECESALSISVESKSTGLLVESIMVVKDD